MQHYSQMDRLHIIALFIFATIFNLQYSTSAALSLVCVDSCAGKSNGNYQYCPDCRKYVTCSNGYKYIMPCPANLVWDDNMKRCEWMSSTCPESTTAKMTTSARRTTPNAQPTKGTVPSRNTSTTLSTTTSTITPTTTRTTIPTTTTATIKPTTTTLTTNTPRKSTPKTTTPTTVKPRTTISTLTTPRTTTPTITTCGTNKCLTTTSTTTIPTTTTITTTPTTTTSTSTTPTTTTCEWTICTTPTPVTTTPTTTTPMTTTCGTTVCKTIIPTTTTQITTEATTTTPTTAPTTTTYTTTAQTKTEATTTTPKTTSTTNTPVTTTSVGNCYIHEPMECCIRKQMRISLEDDVPVVYGKIPFVNVMEQTNGKDRCVCDAKILLNATFQKNSPDDACQGCTNVPKCGNKMLRIDLEMAPMKTGFSFHVGDSRTNDGYKRAASTQENDAEFISLEHQHMLYGSSTCPNISMIMAGLLSNSITSVTIFVGNEFIRVSNNQGYVYELCSKCLFSLNGQSDSQGPVNEDIFIGLNRIIASSSYSEGTGVCSAVISWACPWDR